jgi:hypothetical protein
MQERQNPVRSRTFSFTAPFPQHFDEKAIEVVVLDSQLEAARAFQKTTLASRVGARLNDGKGR